MRVAVLAGGYGGARLARGLRDHLNPGNPPSRGHGSPGGPARGQAGPHEIDVIVNTADDIRLHGLHISPDLDTVMYTLGGGLDEERGWGRRDEAFRANEELSEYGVGGSWFGLGDRDLATHLIRTQLREAGYPLTEVTEALCRRWQPGVTILPMTDDRAETHVVIEDDNGRRAVHFQDWWIRLGAEPDALSFVITGIEDAAPTPQVRSAIESADAIVLAPSNPIVSIGSILAVPGIRELLAVASAPIVGVSPIIGGSPLRGMADKCLATSGIPGTALGVAAHYGSRATGGLLDAWVIDEQDAELADDVRELGIEPLVTRTIMTDQAAAAALAGQVLDCIGVGPGLGDDAENDGTGENDDAGDPAGQR